MWIILVPINTYWREAWPRAVSSQLTSDHLKQVKRPKSGCVYFAPAIHCGLEKHLNLLVSRKSRNGTIPNSAVTRRRVSLRWSRSHPINSGSQRLVLLMNGSYRWSGSRWAAALACCRWRNPEEAGAEASLLRLTSCYDVSAAEQTIPTFLLLQLCTSTEGNMWERCGRGALTCTHTHIWSLSKVLLLIWHIYLPHTPTGQHINSVWCTCPLQHLLKPLTVLMKMVIVVFPSSFKFNRPWRISSWRFFFFLLHALP